MALSQGVSGKHLEESGAKIDLAESSFWIRASSRLFELTAVQQAYVRADVLIDVAHRGASQSREELE